MNKSVFDFKFWKLYSLIALLYIALSYIANTSIFTDSFYYNSLLDKIDISRITEIISFQHKSQTIGYFIIPIVLFLKLLVIASIIFTGLYLFQQKLSYKNCLKIVIVAELVSIVSTLVRVAWLITDMPKNAKSLEYFSPLSITQFLHLGSLPKYLFYPLQLFNVFEIAYWFVLGFGIMAFTQQRWAKSLKIVASSYGVALGIWVVFVIFIQVQFT